MKIKIFVLKSTLIYWIERIKSSKSDQMLIAVYLYFKCGTFNIYTRISDYFLILNIYQTIWYNICNSGFIAEKRIFVCPCVRWNFISSSEL